MDVLDPERWQFGVTTVHRFFFVPITWGLVWFVALLNSAVGTRNRGRRSSSRSNCTCKS